MPHVLNKRLDSPQILTLRRAGVLSGAGVWSWLSALICTAVLPSGLLERSLAQAPTTYYVATNGNNNWSGTREAPIGGDGPFLTIFRAQMAVRVRIAAGMTSDITVLVRGGEYFQDFQLNFGPSDSGRNGYKVIYKNYSGERPTIHRGRRLSGWQLDSGNIYRVPVDWTFNALYENGARCVKARYPNITPDNPYVYNQTSATIAGAETRKFGFRPGDIPVVSNPTALEVVLWAGGRQGYQNWWRDDFTVSSIDYSARIVTLLQNLTVAGTAEARDVIGAGSRYFVQGAKELLDQPGEFWVGNGFLYYWPRQTPIEKQVILAPGPAVGGIFGFLGASPSDPVHDIQVEGLTLGYTDRYRDAINLGNADRVAVKGNHIFNTGGNGIFVGGGGKKNTFTDNLIHDVGFDGILIQA